MTRRRPFAAFAGAMTVAARGHVDAADALVARVDGGLVRGRLEGPALAFKGIPYAAPPVGDLRWAPPRPPAPWRGVRDAADFGPVCPQPAAPGRPAAQNQNEACLTLNVWRPAVGSAAAPVMVWIHGGGDVTGTASQPQFDGGPFARDGVVFVSIEYRLGALGWFAHPALTKAASAGAPLANYGLMDQIAALRWVQRNIAAFGGDPRRVTVAGESAGAEGVLFLMTAPKVRGLFAQAIVESAPGWVRDPDLADAEAAGEALARRAGAPAGASLPALRALPVSALLAAQGDMIGAVVDGRLVVAQPAQAFAAGTSLAVPLLIGSNDGEDNLLGDSDPKGALADISASDRDALRAAYAEAGDGVADDAQLGRLVFRDSVMGAPAQWIAGRQSVRGAHLPLPVRLCAEPASPEDSARASWDGDAFRVRGPGACASPAQCDHAGRPGGNDQGSRCWVAFVKAGRPDCPGGPVWLPYDPRQDRLMVFADASTGVVPDTLAGAYAILDRLDAPSPRAR